MILKLLLLFVSVGALYSLTLEKQYYFSDANITTSLFSAELEPKLLFSIEKKEKVRIKCKDIIKLLAYDGIKCRYSYVEFIKKSPIDTSRLEEELKKYYLSYYPNMQIISLKIHPQNYIKYLPSEYSFKIKAKNYKKSEGNFYIIDNEKRKIFFYYTIDAYVDIYQAKRELRRNELISAANTLRKRVHFRSFKDLPITAEELGHFESVHNINKNSIITQRDIRKSYLVKRHESVILEVRSGALVVETSATAMQNGKLHDIITVEKADKTRLKAKIVSKNRVQIN